MTTSKAEGRVLLPSYINPIRYDLKLTPDFENFTFVGHTSIELTTTNGVGSEITMHSKELCFASASYVVKGGGDGEKCSAEEIRVNMKTTTVTFVFGSDLPANATLVRTISTQYIICIYYYLFLFNQNLYVSPHYCCVIFLVKRLIIDCKHRVQRVLEQSNGWFLPQ